MSNTIRVVNVQPDDFVLGGVQRRSMQVARRLDAEGIETLLMVSSASPGPFSLEAADLGFDLVRVEASPRPRRPRDLASLWFNVRWIASLPAAITRFGRALRKADPDIVHVNGLLNLVPAVAARLQGRRLVWHLIGDHYPLPVVRLLRPLVRLLSHRIVVIARKLERYYMGASNVRNVEVIYEPVDVERWGAGGHAASIGRTDFGFGEDHFVVGSIGNLTPSKGWTYFIDAAETILASQPQTRFLVIGAEAVTQRSYATRLRSELERRNLQNKIVLTGFRQDVPDLLRLCDLYMMASVEEGTPLAILEAMASGLCVIATDVGGIAEQVLHERTGLLVPPRDAGALARSCLLLIDRPDLQHRYASAARKHVLDHFSLEACVEHHRRLYRTLANV